MTVWKNPTPMGQDEPTRRAFDSLGPFLGASGATVLGYSTDATQETGIAAGSDHDLTDASVTFTAEAGRLVYAHAVVVATQVTSASTVSLKIKESTTTLGTIYCTLDPSYAGILIVSYLTTALTAGSYTWKLTLSTGAGTVNREPLAINFMVHDLGAA